MNRLVNDFNEMAEKLQTLDAQRNLWNAAIAHELRTPVTYLTWEASGDWLTALNQKPSLFRNLLKQTGSDQQLKISAS